MTRPFRVAWLENPDPNQAIESEDRPAINKINVRRTPRGAADQLGFQGFGAHTNYVPDRKGSS